MIIKLNPNLASPTTIHKNKNKNLNSNPVFSKKYNINAKEIIVINSKINKINLTCE